jgi:exonuclease SbcC
MFDFLRLVNFQSHRDTRVDFAPGVNVIFGLSQAGKTALIRGFQLLADNRPSGARFYANFAPDKGVTRIELGIKGSGTVSIEKGVRRKSDGSKDIKETIYQFGDDLFTGVQRDVPDQIREILNLTELNVQKQFDQPFLVTSSAGEIARTINRITKLDNVDGWISDLAEKINTSKKTVKILESQSKELEIELGRYVGFEGLQADMDSLLKTASDLKVAYQTGCRAGQDRRCRAQIGQNPAGIRHSKRHRYDP